jgi:glutamate/tyrosine decarboxylase-like PLP-dependent enzyme
MYKERREATLDPEDWDELTELGHLMLEDMMDYLKTIRDQPYKSPPKEVEKAILTSFPEKGDGVAKVYDIIKNQIIPYSLKNTRPDFWGHVAGTGSPFGMLTEMVISGMNHAVGHGPLAIINYQTLDWIKELLEYPMEAGGVFVSGGSEANFTGLAVARNAKADIDMKVEGMQSVQNKMTLYCSDETHACLERSVELLGLGSDALRWIKTDDDCRISLNSLKDAVSQDRKQGYLPFCLIGNAGTVNSGAFDDLNALADFSNKENLWFHVDAVFGAWVKLSEKYKHLADGLERADSIAVDLHKWMSMPYAIGFTLVRDQVAHVSTFVYGKEARYLKTSMDVLEDYARTHFLNMSLALSRPDYGLKAYMLLRAFGRAKYCDLIEQNIDQIHYLAELIKKEPNLEVTLPVVSNVVCFRYKRDGLTETEIDDINQHILRELLKINLWMISDTKTKNKYMLRACNVNHRSRYSDFDLLVERITTIGDNFVKDYL